MATLLRLTRHSVTNPQNVPGAFAQDIEVVRESAARQVADIKRIFGEDVAIVEVPTFKVEGDAVEAVKAEIAKVSDTVVAVEVVLPPNMLAVLTNPKAGLPMIVKAEMKFGERRPDGQPAAPAIFTKYQKVIRVVVETEDL